jgi:multiple sugar transport system ATP-binding protein
VGGIAIRNVSKVFPNGVRAVDDVSLDIGENELMVLVGPSGCGKTTLLRMIAGLEEVTEGSIEIGGRDVTSLRPRERDIAMVFQDYALYPHMTVGSNLEFGLRNRHTPKLDIARRVGGVARVLGLDPLVQRRPAALSGGQRQRVAIGRAIVREPRAFLLDEPLSNLDAKLRVSMRAEIARLHARLGTATVYVTHDQIEAMTLGHRVAVMRDGLLQQCDTPRRLFRNPVNVFVAGFIGSPAMNFVEAEVAGDTVAFGEHELGLPPSAAVFGQERTVILGLRPTAFGIGSRGDEHEATMRVKAEVIEELGAEDLVIFGVDAPRISSETLSRADDEELDDMSLLADDRRCLVVARVDARHAVGVGDAVELAVDTSELHFFDPATGTALAA